MMKFTEILGGVMGFCLIGLMGLGVYACKGEAEINVRDTGMGIPPEIYHAQEGALTEVAQEVTTAGNFSFLELKTRSGEHPHSNWKETPGCVVKALDSFEKSHADLEVVNWQVREWWSDYGSSVLGIWIQHRPKQR